jgi:hypothetical protein
VARASEHRARGVLYTTLLYLPEEVAETPRERVEELRTATGETIAPLWECG